MTESTRRKPKSLRDILKEILPEYLHQRIFKAYDQIGSIAIVDIPPELIHYEKQIAKLLLEHQKSIKTVCKKAGVRGGIYRRQPLRVLAGKRTKETVHKESGAVLKLHVEKVYFSPRMSTERKRIADQVKPGEKVIVLFSGCAPYPCVIAKNAKPEKIVAIELNPLAHKYAVENVKLNKLKNVQVIEGDVRKIAPTLKEKWARIIMALPFGGESFLDVALKISSEGTVIHFYDFGKEQDLETVTKKVLDACRKEGKSCRILLTKTCGQNAPRSFRIVVDFVVES